MWIDIVVIPIRGSAPKKEIRIRIVINTTLATMLRLFSATNRSTVVGSVMDPDPHHFGKIRIRIKVKSWIRICIKWKQDPDPHQSEKVEALEDHFKALEGPN
jgi:hypothetical protein